VEPNADSISVKILHNCEEILPEKEKGQ